MKNKKNSRDLDVNFHGGSMYWYSGLAVFFASFLTGGTRIFSKNLDGETLLNMIEKYKISSLFIASIYTYRLTNAENKDKYDTSSVRSIMTGGSSLNFEQYKRLNDLFKSDHILFAYGLSEIGGVATYDLKVNKIVNSTRTTPCGRVYRGIIIKIVDPDTNTILGPNQKGEVCIKSPGIMLGYYKIDINYLDSSGFLKTGDLGYVDDNEYLYVIDRLQETFKYLNWPIFPSMIEAVLLEHAGIAEAVVFGVPCGKDGQAPGACVVLKIGVKIGKKEIEDFVAVKLSDTERLRGGIYFVDSLPRSPAGKVNRKEIRDNILKSLQ